MDSNAHELLVDRAAANLPPQQFAAFRRLARELAAHTSRWGLFLLQYEHVNERDSVAAAIGKLVSVDAVVHAETQPDWTSLEAAIVAAAATARLVQVIGLDDWLATSPDPAQATARLHAWNIRREAFARSIEVPIVCWMRPATLTLLAQTAPDLWSWRAGVHDFSLPLSPPVRERNPVFREIAPQNDEIDNRTVAQRTSRVREIQEYLQQADPGALALRGKLLDELARLSLHLGRVDEALRIYRDEELPIFDKLGDVSSRAITMSKIADILQARGEHDEALRIQREEVLQVYDNLGDVRSRAVTMSKIAFILQARGEFDEAMRIHREEALPVYDTLGDERALAVTMAHIADILRSRGELDEALRISREEVLPVFDKLSDVRSRALTMGKICDILQAQGELDVALRIRREEVLPVFEQLGDVRLRAATMGKIADILQTRGELDEALRIHREEELPIYDKLGDVRERAVTMGKIASILQAWGELDEALCIYREEQLPVFEQLSDARSLLVAQANIAQVLMRRARMGDYDEARQLLTKALLAAQRMCLPEVATIQGILLRLRGLAST